MNAILPALLASAFTNSATSYNGQIYFDGTSLWITSAANQQAIESSQYPSGIWPTTAFETSTAGCSSSFGYGTFHFKGQIGYSHSQLTQGPGANYVLWNADNSWLSSKNGSQVSEFDLLETNYNNLGQGVATAHYYDPSAGNNNGQVANTNIAYIGSDFTYQHNYDVVWTDTSMTEYVDGVSVLSVPSQNLPKDYAHGGCNKTLGLQMAMQAQGYDDAPTAQLLTQEVWWSPSQSIPNYGTNPPPPPTQTNVLTISNPSGVIAGRPFSVTGTNNYMLTGATLLIDSTAGNSQAPMTHDSSFTVSGPATLTAGSHTAQVVGQDGTLSNQVTFSVAATQPAPTGLHVDGAVLTGSTLSMTVEKLTGGPATIKIKVDGAYQGTAGDYAHDGSINIVRTLSPVPAPGNHTVTVYIDGTAMADTATFSVEAIPTPPT